MTPSPNPQPPTPSPLRFLVVKLADLGDVLTITPALRALRRSYPDARIDALVTPTGAAALRGLDSVNDLITFEKARFDRLALAHEPLWDAVALARRLRGARYSHVFLLHHLFTGFGRLKYAVLLATTGAPFRAGLAEGKPAYLTNVALDRGYGVIHEADYWLEVVGLVGARNPEPRFEIAIDRAANVRANDLLGPDSGYRIALYPGSGPYSLARRWPIERYREVARRLMARYGQGAVEIVIVGTAAERDLAGTLSAELGPGVRNLVGMTDLKTLAAVLARCDLLIGNDGGVMHAARAVNTPVVAIFGPTNPVSWGPYGGEVWGDAEAQAAASFVVRADLPCSPCLYRGFLPGTPHGCLSRDCLQFVDPEAVVRAATRLMNNERQPADDHKGAGR